MPLSWKKTKIARISQIVADIPSPRHGGSLVVETGFPTSLIDLFLKNRDRLKKPSPKKRNKTNRAEPEISDFISPSSPSLLGFRSCMSRNDSLDASLQPSIQRIVNSERIEEVERVGDQGGDRDQVESRGESRGVFYSVLKVFLVVILALSTKKLAVGITLSAFLLLTLEFVGKHAVRLVKPCSDVKSALESLTRGASGFFQRKNVLALENDDNKSDSKQLIMEEDEFIEEIQSVEPNLDAVERIQRLNSSRPELDFLSRESRWGHLDGEKQKWNGEESEEGDEVSLDKNQTSKRAKLKAKIIRKLVPKKLRSVKKMKKKEKDFEHSSEPSSFLEENKSFSLQKPEQVDGKPEEEEEEEEGEKEEELAVIEVSEREGNKGYIILIFIALIGLMGGRIPALLVTVAGSFMFKLIKAQRKSLMVQFWDFLSPGPGTLSLTFSSFLFQM